MQEQKTNVLSTTFRNRALPCPAYLAGYSALIDRFSLDVPLHHEMTAVSPKNQRLKEDGWTILPSTIHRPQESVIDQLVFALKNEGVHLLTLKKVFEAFDKTDLEEAACRRPTSGYLRRLCHLYEWLTETHLALPDVTMGTYVLLVDPKQQYGTAEGKNARRFLVRHNLPGTRAFCPVVFRTRQLDGFIKSDLSKRARAIVDNASPALIGRAAAFLLLSDSKSSFAIEGEHPPKDRISRWGAAIGRASTWRFDTDALVALQRGLIGDDRLVQIGLRSKGGFVGRHDAMGQPVPEHVSAKADDLSNLIDGLVAFARTAREADFHPVLTAACVAFGFVYIHPFEDGNGRIHRFLIHHVLAASGFTPTQIVFPVSSVILEEVVEYKHVLERIATPLLDFIQWTATREGNVEVINNTSDFYRYFDATVHCEFLFKCIERCVQKVLPEELVFLEHRDDFHRRVTEIVDMGERTLDLLLRMLKQGHGALSKRARTQEFSALKESEVQEIQAIYRELFGPT